MAVDFSESAIPDLVKIYEADCRGMNLELKMPIFESVSKEFFDHVSNFQVKKEEPLDPLSGVEIMELFHMVQRI